MAAYHRMMSGWGRTKGILPQTQRSLNRLLATCYIYGILRFYLSFFSPFHLLTIPMTPRSKILRYLCSTVVFRGWSQDQQLQHHLQTLQKCNFLSPGPESDTLGMGPRNLFSRVHQMIPPCTLCLRTIFVEYIRFLKFSIPKYNLLLSSHSY